MNKVDCSLYLVTDRQTLGSRDLYKSIEEAILGGVTLIQLREKDISTLEFYEIALKVKEITSRYEIPLIINDRIDIALACDAEGLHIGQSDMPLEIARKILGKHKIIGVSAPTVEKAKEAEQNGADYIGVGAIFPTGSKNDAVTIGLEPLQDIRKAVNVPVVAIGGINADNCAKAISSGADGIAVISAILGKEDIKKASEALLDYIKRE
jgi:thiamine-phosphate pyrophosphorylase